MNTYSDISDSAAPSPRTASTPASASSSSPSPTAQPAETVTSASGTQPSRRKFLGGLAVGATAVGATAVGTTGVLGSVYSGTAAAQPGDAARVFAHGIASGDPTPDRVILWTRVTPTPDATPGSGRGARTSVKWEIATDPSFTSVAASGTTTTDPSQDLTVKVDAGGLSPNTRYHYRFHVLDGPAAGAVSPVGATKTVPPYSADLGRVRLGVVSCSNWEAGYFSAYRHMAAQPDLDAIVHLGDYIYEYGAGEYGGHDGSVRLHQPKHDIVSLADYRIRHAQYKTDPDLAAAHRLLPWICTWDDHESADNAYHDGAVNHKPNQGDWHARKANSEQAYYEWMPVRPVPDGNGRHLYRRFRYGKLLELSMLDLRTYRTKQPSSISKRVDARDATITGAAQLAWLTAGLESSPTTWKIVGNPVMISPILIPPLEPKTTSALTTLLGVPAAGVPLSADSWDGYTADRLRLLNTLRDKKIKNTVFITGDIHMSFAADVPIDAANYPGGGSVATELVVTSVTSNNVDDIVGVPEDTVGLAAAAALTNSNRHLRWANTDAHGYAVLTVTPQASQMDWYFLTNRADPRTTQRYAQSWRVGNGTQRVERVTRPA